MPLGSLPPDSLFPGSAACPTSCPLHGAVALRPRSRLISHPGTRPPLAFFVAPRAAIAPVGCSFADSASARAETRSSTASLRSHSPIAAASTNFISFRFSATCSASAVLRRDPPTREWPSANSPRHLSETNSRTPFSPRSFRYRRNAVQLAFSSFDPSAGRRRCADALSATTARRGISWSCETLGMRTVP
jgi:hypothetical protein